MTGCSGQKELKEEEFEKYQTLLKEYYQAYGAGDFDKAIGFFNKKFEYEEAGQKYVGEDIIKAAIVKNQHLRHQFKVRTMENIAGGILVTLDNSSYLLSISGVDSYTSQEFFTFKKDKIESVQVKIDEAEFQVISTLIEATPGIGLEAQEAGFVIRSIAPDAPGAESGLKQGARLLAIDQVAVEDFQLGINEAVYRLSGRNGTQVEIQVEQDGQQKTFLLDRYVPGKK